MNNINEAEIQLNLVANAYEYCGYWLELRDTNFKEVKGQPISNNHDAVETVEDCLFTDGGYWTVIDNEGQLDEPKKITQADIKSGWQIFKTKYEGHFNDAIEENDDAITADVFLQCVIFGDCIFG